MPGNFSRKPSSVSPPATAKSERVSFEKVTFPDRCRSEREIFSANTNICGPASGVQLRHSFATLHLQSGTPIEWVSRQLGHADVTTTFKHYYHYIPDRQKAKYTGVLPVIKKGTADNLIVIKAK